MPKSNHIVFATTSAMSVASATSSTAGLAARSAARSAAGQGAGPAPSAVQRPPLRELPRGGRRGAPAAAARNRYQAPRRTY
ncbi:hypothetical protein ACHGLA_18985 [Streptomyces sp. YH02]|uniref:hypothetical protein n=1 Tax=Streptomyces sp. YH02 TaxID=3256999 RepID=UPI003756630D